MDMLQKTMVVLALSLLCSCSTIRPATLYPVSGPIFDAGRVQPLTGTFIDNYSGIGKCSVTLPDGQVCNGEWSMVVNTVNTSASLMLGDAWGTLYGDSIGFASGGQRPGMATLICPGNNVLQIAFLAGGSAGHGIGVGTDTVGNYYKVHF